MVTTRLTALPGSAIRPSWSPDGKWIAFVYEREDGPATLRIVPADPGRTAAELEETREITTRPISWWFPFGYGQEVPQWSPDAAGILVAAETQWPPGSDAATLGILHLLGGEKRELFDDGRGRTYFQWSPGGDLAYIQDNLLWRARLSPHHGLEAITRVSPDPALYPSIARDGTVLFLSTDGFRLARAGDEVETLGWPLSYEVTRPAEGLVIRNARLIDGTGPPPAGLMDAWIEGERIRRIVPSGELSVPARGVQVLDAEGRTVIPGLIDLHAHVWDDLILSGLLSFGVTTVRDAFSPIARTAALRESIEAGVMVGPRIVLGGFQLLADAPAMAGSSGHIEQIHANLASAERALGLARGFGADYAKLYFSNYTEAGVHLVSAARAAGLTVSGHVATSLPLLAAGLSGKEHLGQSGDLSDGLVHDDVIALYRASGIWVVPTITAFASAQRVGEDPGMLESAERQSLISPFIRAWVGRPLGEAGLRTRAEWADGARRSAARLGAAGVTIAAGADLLLPWAIHWELEELVDIGLTPMEAILAATSVAAEVLNASDQIGSLERGKLADLVILDADPLEDIRNTRRIWRVVKGGLLHHPDALASVN